MIEYLINPSPGLGGEALAVGVGYSRDFNFLFVLKKVYNFHNYRALIFTYSRVIIF